MNAPPAQRPVLQMQIVLTLREVFYANVKSSTMVMEETAQVYIFWKQQYDDFEGPYRNQYQLPHLNDIKTIFDNLWQFVQKFP